MDMRFRLRATFDSRPLRLLILLVLVTAGCGRGTRVPDWSGFDGDPGRGVKVVAQAGCGQCHRINGMPDAVGMVGPPLGHFATRTTIAGLLPNTPENLARWIRQPQAVLPGNVMPDMDLSEQQARDAAAYLHTLR